MLIGRGEEIAAVDRLLESARSGRSGVLVVRGEAGIGKTALLEHAVASAEGMRVLHGVGIESESELAFAALHQLLRSVFDRLDRLPEPQSAALRAAFALSSETVGDRFRVSLGVLGLLAEVADEQAVLCVVDDAQWLDQPSADALLFAARRLEAEPLVLLFAARDDPTRPFAAPGLRELRPRGLGSRDARALVADRFGPEVPTEILDWVLANADGNPLALVELPAALTSGQLAGLEPFDGVLPPTTSVEQAYFERVRRLEPEVRRLLVLASCEDAGERATIGRAATALGLDPDELVVAEREGLITVGRDRIEFRHPLVRSVVYRGAGFAEREHGHRTLAAVLTSPGDADRRAWHHAAATVGTDDEVAHELESSADRARLRAGYSAAATALERAFELTGHPGERARRLVAAAGAAWHAGDAERATALLDRASPIVSDPRLRAELDHVRGVIELRCGDLLDAGATLIEGAANVALLDPHKALEMLVDAGSVAGRSGDIVRMAEVGSRAAALPRSGDPVEEVLTDLLVGVGGFIEGKTAREVPLILDAIARAGDFDDVRVLSWAATGATTVGAEATELALLRQAVAVARDSGAVDTLVLVLETVVSSGVVSGRYDVESEAAEGLRLARDAGLPNLAGAHLAALAWIAALKGREDDCRAYAAEVTGSVHESHLANANSTAEWAVALLELGSGRYEAAAARLAALRAAPHGVGHPFFVVLSAADLVEAWFRAGREDEARAAFAVLEGFAQPGAPTWALALAARSRALLGPPDEAEREFEAALRLHAESNRHFDLARTEVLFGEFLRRVRRRAEAREHLRAALDGFERFGAEHWAEHARAELRAAGESARRRDPSTIDRLTPQELQIARLVAAGGSNKEIAAQLFLSPRTVEYHLRKVFAKLGITSRSQLIRRGVGEDTEPMHVG